TEGWWRGGCPPANRTVAIRPGALFGFYPHFFGLAALIVRCGPVSKARDLTPPTLTGSRNLRPQRWQSRTRLNESVGSPLSRPGGSLPKLSVRRSAGSTRRLRLPRRAWTTPRSWSCSRLSTGRLAARSHNSRPSVGGNRPKWAEVHFWRHFGPQTLTTSISH